MSYAEAHQPQGRNNNHIGIPEDLKGYVCVMDGTLYVANVKKGTATCFNFESRLRKSGRIEDKKVVALPKLQELQQKQEQQTQGREQEIDASELVQDAQNLFREAAKKNVSDIHIRVHQSFADVLFRIDGALQEHSQMPTNYANALLSTIYQVMAEGDSLSHPYYQPTTFQDARVADAEHLPKNLHSIRIASGPKVGGRFMVLRLLYAETEKTSGNLKNRLFDLGYSSLHVKTVGFMRDRPTGINIIAGPTGSGKSTTLKHQLESISDNRPDLNIMSVEDPPEYPMQGVVQMPVTNTDSNEDRANAFGDAIRMALRSDPDIIMIGEIRDPESAQLAFRAAQTGHQVWTTLHANSAFGILSRLIDILGSGNGDPITYLSDPTLLTGLVFQKLVRKTCPHCKIQLIGNEDRLPDNGILNRISKVIDMSQANIHIVGDGCSKCQGTGIKGRTILAEVVAPDPEMLRILRETESVEAARQHWVEKQNGKTVIHHALDKIASGDIDPVQAERVVGPLIQDLVFADGVLEEEELDGLDG